MKKHPQSLYIFFTTEMWERYGFYVVQSLLALYLAFYFKWPDDQIYILVGSFTALTYLSPMVGGWIADNLIGQKKAVLLGAIVLFINYVFLAFIDNSMGLIAVLAGIALGTGLLKPNISSLLGNEYIHAPSMRESGFTIFYMGITTGIILGTTLPSILQEHFGWHFSFFSAALGMIFALTIFFYGIIKFKIKDYNVFAFGFRKVILALICMILLWMLSFCILYAPQFGNFTFGLVVISSVIYILISVYTEDQIQARQTLVIGLLCLISVLFWAFYFQMFMSLTLFLSRVVEPYFLGIKFPPPYYITVQSIGMLLIGTIISIKYKEQNPAKPGLNVGKKFLYAMILISCAYAIIALASSTNKAILIPPLFLIPAYLLISLAELLLSPVGLSAITLLAAKNKVSTMMGIFFVSLGVGGFLAGKLAALTVIPAGETKLEVLKTLYANAFIKQLWILAGATLVCLFLFLLIRRMTT